MNLYVNNRAECPRDLVSAYKVATNWKGVAKPIGFNQMLVPPSCGRPRKSIQMTKTATLIPPLQFYARWTGNLLYETFVKKTIMQWNVLKRSPGYPDDICLTTKTITRAVLKMTPKRNQHLTTIRTKPQWLSGLTCHNWQHY